MVSGAPSASRTPHVGLFRAAAALAVVVGAGSCVEQNAGVDPPADRVFFPTGLLLDPAAPADRPPRWLYMVNANSDLRFNGGTVAAVDLDKFWDAWALPNDNPRLRTVAPQCDREGGNVVGPCVRPPGGAVDEALPCRRLATSPQVVECEETSFLTTATAVGSFGSVLDASLECADRPCQACEDPCDCDTSTRLWVPIRNDPSITYLDVRWSREGGDCVPRIECGDDYRCDEAHRLQHQRNDPDLPAMSRDPFNLVVSPAANLEGAERFAYVTHLSTAELTLVDLDGVVGPGGVKTGEPAIVDLAAIFALGSSTPGGFGMAERPCFAVGEGPNGDADPDPNEPAVTNHCRRPLLYGAHRWTRVMQMLTTASPDPGEDRTCAADSESIKEPGAVVCDAQVRGELTIIAPGLDPGPGAGGEVFGDMAFGDARGDQLFVVQTNPGALLRFDTSLDDRGQPANVLAGTPVELCQEPTALAIYDQGEARVGLISCFRSGYVAAVDLDRMQIIRQIVAGTGPNDIQIDAVRGVAYVSNSLEKTISVIDLAVERLTRYSEIARIGLQDPYTG